MNIKQYFKHALVVVALSATTVFAATTWPGISGVQDGQIIQATTLHDSLQHLYERSWDFLGGDENYIATNLSVAAPEYCDENGENCFVADQVSERAVEVGGATRPNDDWADVVANVSFIEAYDQAPIVYAIVKDAEFGGPCRGYNVNLEAPVTNVTASGFSVTFLGSWSGCGWRKVTDIAWFVIPQPVDNNMIVTFEGNNSWRVGAWGSCEVVGTQSTYIPADKGQQAQTLVTSTYGMTRSVTCTDVYGTAISNSNCSGTAPAATQSCSPPREGDYGGPGDHGGPSGNNADGTPR